MVGPAPAGMVGPGPAGMGGGMVGMTGPGGMGGGMVGPALAAMVGPAPAGMGGGMAGTPGGIGPRGTVPSTLAVVHEGDSQDGNDGVIDSSDSMEDAPSPKRALHGLIKARKERRPQRRSMQSPRTRRANRIRMTRTRIGLDRDHHATE